MKGGHTVKRITTDELRAMTDREGLILQGCGGELSEWVNGINELLTQEDLQIGDTSWMFRFELTAAPTAVFYGKCGFEYGKLAICVCSPLCFRRQLAGYYFPTGGAFIWMKHMHNTGGRLEMKQRTNIPSIHGGACCVGT
jgi:hypothetical protein